MDLERDPRVAVAREAARYAGAAPFDPSEHHAELPSTPVGSEDNPAFRAVRACFQALGLDAPNAGTPEWNPLRDLVSPGNTVVVKPNFVSHRNLGDAGGLTDTDGLVTHGSVIRAVLEYVALALEGRGTIIVGDCPVQGSRWDEIVQLVGLREVAARMTETYTGLVLRIEDFRLGTATVSGQRIVARTVDESRRAEYEEVDLGADSLLVPLMQGNYAFGVSQYPRHRMRRAHTPTSNLYLFPRAFLEADVLINVAKLKAHMKAGVTCAMKNLVGVNGHKDYLPHFRFGSPRHGGDEYPDGNWLSDLMWRLMHAEWELEGGARKAILYYAAMATYSLLRTLYRYPRGYASLGGGSWQGNDTAWRMVLDINRAFLYWDRERGQIGESTSGGPRYFAIVDGLVGGHRESPLAPTPYPAGFMIAGRNPLAVDTVCTALMGFDWRRVRQVANAWALERWPIARFQPADVLVKGLPGVAGVEDIYRTGIHARFEPSRGYKGAIEIGSQSPAAPLRATDGLRPPSDEIGPSLTPA